MSKKTFFEHIDKIEERNFNQDETWSILKSNISIYWSWGVSKIFKWKDTALFLKVNGFKHKGWVVITLAWDDTYTVRFLNNQYKELEKHTDVYCDMLRDLIDEKIEKQSNYSF